MTNGATSSSPLIDIEDLCFDAGAHLRVKHALATLEPGVSLRITGRSSGWHTQIAEWCRSHGHQLIWERRQRDADVGLFAHIAASQQPGRWQDVQPAGLSDPHRPHAVAEQASPSWGLSARGARVEPGSPDIPFRLSRKRDIWATHMAQLYAHNWLRVSQN